MTKANTKRPLTLQLDSYILPCLLEHRRFTEHLEKQCWGADHSKVLRWMKGRMVDSTAPTSKLSLRKTSELNSAGTVKQLKKKSFQNHLWGLAAWQDNDHNNKICSSDKSLVID